MCHLNFPKPFFFLDAEIVLGNRPHFWYDFVIQIHTYLTVIVRHKSQYRHQMVKVKASNPMKKASAKSSKVSVRQETHPLPRSPTTRSNTASLRDGDTILTPLQQKTYKLNLAEIKQIQGLLICKCGLTIQAQSYCTQTTQDGLFVRNFPIFYDVCSRDPILGSRVSKIPFVYLTVGTSKATEVINGDKMRKKYSSMKTYINNVLTPIYKRLVICHESFA